MSSLEWSAAAARALRARQETLPPDGPPPELILQSWARCALAGLDSGAPTSISIVEGTELAWRRERTALARRLARAELENLAPQIAGSNFLLAFADHEGVILDLVADNRFATSGAGAGILPGARWGESLCGTNGLGTALATGQAVAVSGLEHYLLQLRSISCTAAPVRDAHGEIVGVLDASSFVESRQRHTLALVQMAATHIENGLLMAQMGARLVLAVHPRIEFLGTLGAGLVAFELDGRLAALNARGRALLHGLTLTPGTPFEDLFGVPFEDLLAQAGRGGDLRLHDVLGSALVVRCVNRPAVRMIATGLAAVDTPRPIERDPAVAAAQARVEAAVQLRVPVLICGEAATGKSMLARHGHAASGRSGPFVVLSGSQLPLQALAEELFLRGAADATEPGPIAAADGGTLVLDEIDAWPLELQAGLLRFLDDRLVRAGARASRRVDVLVLACTGADLDAEAAAQRFRRDLLDSLSTVRVSLPPLRLRRDFDVRVQGMLAALDAGATIDAEALRKLQRHAWPGNFRELRSLLTRALLACREHTVRATEVEALLAPAGAPPPSTLRRSMGEIVRRELERCGGSVSLAARRLGISRTTVYRHLGPGGAAATARVRRSS